MDELKMRDEIKLFGSTPRPSISSQRTFPPNFVRASLTHPVCKLRPKKRRVGEKSAFPYWIQGKLPHIESRHSWPMIFARTFFSCKRTHSRHDRNKLVIMGEAIKNWVFAGSHTKFR